METLSNILASFDIFQVIISAFPQIFLPVAHAFQDIFNLLAGIAGEQFASHPGLIAGTAVFLTGYLSWTGLSKLKRAIVPARPVSPTHSL